MRDGFGREITYLRLSVTDRCDLRCGYCMGGDVTFHPRDDLLTLEELERTARLFVGQGVRKIRVTGGEPLVRRGVLDLMVRLGLMLAGGLDELTMTTNGTLLARHAEALWAAGVRRVNVSLDSLDPDRYRQITRLGSLDRAVDGIRAARDVGLRVKINTVVMAGVNDGEVDALIEWCGDNGFDLTLIETMPMADGAMFRRTHVPLTEIRDRLERRWTLLPSPEATGGPARYLRVAETGLRLGLISALSENFCAGCNRLRLGPTGKIQHCLGRPGRTDLRTLLRAGASDEEIVAALHMAVAAKPMSHDFNDAPERPRGAMSGVGG